MEHNPRVVGVSLRAAMFKISRLPLFVRDAIDDRDSAVFVAFAWETILPPARVGRSTGLVLFFYTNKHSLEPLCAALLTKRNVGDRTRQCLKNHPFRN